MLSGNRSQPENLAINLATEFPSAYVAIKAAIEESLFEHYQPYKEGVNGELDGDDDLLLEIKKPEDIWQYVEMKYILFEKLSGTMTTEIAYTTGWDTEHTLGARLVNGKLLELCGSV